MPGTVVDPLRRYSLATALEENCWYFSPSRFADEETETQVFKSLTQSFPNNTGMWRKDSLALSLFSFLYLCSKHEMTEKEEKESGVGGEVFFSIRLSTGGTVGQDEKIHTLLQGPRSFVG